MKTRARRTDRPWGERDLWVLDPDVDLVQFGSSEGKVDPAHFADEAEPNFSSAPFARKQRCKQIGFLSPHGAP